MNKNLKKIISAITAFALLFSGIAPGFAQIAPENDICKSQGIVFGFFNGVLTTTEEAQQLKAQMQILYGDKSLQGEDIQYELLYNRTQGFEDFVETFEQRLKEHEDVLGGRFELFFEALKGGGSWWFSLAKVTVIAKSVLASFSDWLAAQAAQKLTTLAASPLTELRSTEQVPRELRISAPGRSAALQILAIAWAIAVVCALHSIPGLQRAASRGLVQCFLNYVDHRALINQWLTEGKKLLFVAHSQGNLFANNAYAYAVDKSNLEAVKAAQRRDSNRCGRRDAKHLSFSRHLRHSRESA